MSGECLCGAFAHKDELAEVEMFFPDVAAQIRELEVEVAAAGHPAKICKWGWGATEKLTPEDTALREVIEGKISHELA
jgi:hypothetical protein